MDLVNIKNKINQFSSERDWDQFHSIKNLSMALNVESSELLEIFQWMSEEQSNNIANNPQAFSQLEDEVADIFVYLIRIISKTNIDLEKCVLNKLEKNAAKYPIELAKGNAKKYTDF